MSPPAVIARLAQSEDGASLVLEAERVALAGVELCRLQALRLLAASWLRAELVHKRTEARTERLRERMSAATRVRHKRISSEMAALAADTGADTAILALLDSAIARVTEELAGISEPR